MRDTSPQSVAACRPRLPLQKLAHVGTWWRASVTRHLSSEMRATPVQNCSLRRPYFGALSPLSYQPDTNFIGSSTSVVWTYSHLGHSKVRRSDPAGPGSIRASIMRPL